MRTGPVTAPRPVGAAFNQPTRERDSECLPLSANALRLTSWIWSQRMSTDWQTSSWT